MVLCWQKSKKIFLGKGDAIKLDEFLENFQTAFAPPPSFLENYIEIFMTDMVAYMRGDIVAG